LRADGCELALASGQAAFVADGTAYRLASAGTAAVWRARAGISG